MRQPPVAPHVHVDEVLEMLVEDGNTATRITKLLIVDVAAADESSLLKPR